MATAKTTDARVRSLELAVAKGHTACSHAAKTLGWALDERGELVSLALEIRSATSDAVYAVGYLASSDDALCECEAAQHHAACWHRGLAILCGRAVALVYLQPLEAARREWACDVNAAAIAPSL